MSKKRPVKKAVKSMSALRSDALAKGATISDDSGQKFNSGQQVSTAKRLKPAQQRDDLPADPPKQETPPEPDPGSKLVAEKIDSMGKQNALIMEDVRAQIAQIQLTENRPLVWRFKIIRDKNGFMEEIIAEAGSPRKALN